MNAIVAMTTTNTEREAKKIAAALIDKKIAACVQLIPKILSIYEWKGSIHEDQEYLLLIKMPEKNINAAKKLIKENHSYEVPEFLVLPVVDGMDEYLKWMESVT